MTENPVWKREDGADERLVNPTAFLCEYINPEIGDPQPYQEKTLFVREKYPEFSSQILEYTDELRKMDILSRIFTEDKPTQDEIVRHSQLVTSRLKLVEKFVTDTYGSVEAFLVWWKS